MNMFWVRENSTVTDGCTMPTLGVTNIHPTFVTGELVAVATSRDDRGGIEYWATFGDCPMIVTGCGPTNLTVPVNVLSVGLTSITVVRHPPPSANSGKITLA